MCLLLCLNCILSVLIVLKVPIYSLNFIYLNVNFFLYLHCAGLNEMVIETASSPGPFRNTQMSKAAQTHKLRKLRAPSKCRECDGLVVFHGAECEEVTLVSFLSLFFLIIYFRSNRTKMQHNHDLLFGTLVKSSVPTAFRVLQIPR